MLWNLARATPKECPCPRQDMSDLCPLRLVSPVVFIKVRGRHFPGLRSCQLPQLEEFGHRVWLTPESWLIGVFRRRDHSAHEPTDRFHRSLLTDAVNDHNCLFNIQSCGTQKSERGGRYEVNSSKIILSIEGQQYPLFSRQRSATQSGFRRRKFPTQKLPPHRRSIGEAVELRLSDRDFVWRHCPVLFRNRVRRLRRLYERCQT
jgi:hypothetical protein